MFPRQVHSAAETGACPCFSHARLLTPRGQGGISVIEVWGPDATRALDELFVNPRGRKLSSAPAGALLYGVLRADGEALDEVIIGRHPVFADVFEVNCHGGVVALTRVLAALKRLGIQEDARPTEGVLAGWAGECDDAIRREAVEALPGATTDIAARMLLDQFAGALSDRLEKILSLLRDGTGHATAAERIRSLLLTAPLGIGLCNPMRIVVAGRPNVGKSTLVNRLLAEERVVAHDQPGTTRDPVEQGIAIGGYPFVLVDTAGLPGDVAAQERADGLARLSAQKSREQLDNADVILLLFDATAPCSDDDEEIARTVRRDRAIPLLNKCDLAECSTADIAPWLRERFDRPPLPISALTGAGMAELESAVLSRAFALRWQAGMPVVFTLRQVRLLESALAADAGDSAAAQVEACLRNREEDA